MKKSRKKTRSKEFFWPSFKITIDKKKQGPYNKHRITEIKTQCNLVVPLVAKGSKENLMIKQIQLETEDDNLLTVEQLAEKLSVSKHWIYHQCTKKKNPLPKIKLGGGSLNRFSWPEVQAWIQKNR